MEIMPGLESLRNLLPLLNNRFRYAVEVRHHSWFQDLAYNFFADNDICLVWSQLAKLRTPSIVTTDFLYVRFIGDRSINEKDFGWIQKDRVLEMREWAEQIKKVDYGLGKGKGRGGRRETEASPFALDLSQAAIDSEIHAGDERTFIGGEEHDGGRDFLGLTSATKWNLRGELGGRLLGLLRGKARRLLEGRGLGWSGAHRIHADLAVFQLHSPGAREVAHSRLTRGVDAKPWDS
jgi:hypothetical protein